MFASTTQCFPKLLHQHNSAPDGSSRPRLLPRKRDGLADVVPFFRVTLQAGFSSGGTGTCEAVATEKSTLRSRSQEPTSDSTNTPSEPCSRLSSSSAFARASQGRTASFSRVMNYCTRLLQLDGFSDRGSCRFQELLPRKHCFSSAIPRRRVQASGVHRCRRLRGQARKSHRLGGFGFDFRAWAAHARCSQTGSKERG